MKKTILAFFVLLFAAGLTYSQVATNWEKSAAAGTKPAWETGNTTRGIAYGLIGTNHRLLVVNRNAAFGGKQIFIFNAATGDSVGKLDTTGIAGGTIIVNDVEVSSDGKIFVANVAVGGIFKVYKYDNETSAPAVVISYDATGKRLGDKITVTGSTADNSIVIWAPSANATGEVVKFTTADNGATFTANIVNIGALVSFASASAGPLANGDFYFNAHGMNAQKFSSTGSLLGTIPNTVLGTGGSAVRFLKTVAGDEYIAANALGTGFELAKIIKVTGGTPSSATLYSSTTALGTNSAVGTGDIAIQAVSNFVYNVYVLSTNNGFGAYKVTIKPQLAGNYYIGAPGTGPGGSNPQFANMREAFEVLNDAAFTGDCTFYITSDINEVYPTPFVGLGLAINPDPFTVTFKPYTGVQPVITLNYLTDSNSGPSGGMVIGIPSKGNISWDSLRTTKNIMIDGSNTVGGTSRDLTIQSATNGNRNAIPLVVAGDVSNLTVKNTKIYYKAQAVSTSGNLFIGAIMMRSRNYLSKNWAPHDVTFENNHISGNFDGVAQSSQGYGCYQSGVPNVKDYPYNITLKNNLIEGKRRSVVLYKAGSHNIFGNEIILNQTVAANVTNEAIYAVDVDTNAVVNIYNNKISKISSVTNAANNGNTGISIESLGTYNIYNNMIYGFELTAANLVAYLRGIKNSSATAIVNLNFNSVYMNNISDIGTGTVTYDGILISNGTNDLKNNIVFSAETDFANYCINRTGALGTLNSDYNDLYSISAVNGNVGYWNTAAAQTLAAWQTASAGDANSLNVNPQFVSTTDLHLSTNTSLVVGKGIAVAGITNDFDNETRDAIPEIGADEYPNWIPVELVSFKADFNNNKVILSWQTATELNSSHFVIERKSNSEWDVIGQVNSAGNSTQIIDYSFVDENVSSTTLYYRLKQVDLDGSYSYSKEVEVNTLVPSVFALNQNYPNPFNPITRISYSVPFDSKVTISVYSLTGELVAELVNQDVSAGSHQVDFDGSSLASGVYMYRMQAGTFNASKKLILLK